LKTCARPGCQKSEREPRKLTAILVADVVGYGRLASVDEDRILARLRVDGNLEEAKAALAEARRLNPKLTVKSMPERYPDFAWMSEGLRKAGLPEE
jgi:hypothetical protein